MTEAHIKWKYNFNLSDNFNEEYSFKIDAVNIYTLEKEVCIHRSENTKAAVALVSAGYLGMSPEFPSLAISLQILELYYTLCLFKPSFSVEAFAKALCHLYSLPFRRGYCTGLSDTFDIYLAIQRRIDTQVAKELGHEGANYRILNSCPACCYNLEDGLELEFSRMWVVDRNNSLKCMAGIGNREFSDTRIFGESDYYLSKDFVNIYAGEIKTRPLARNIEDEDPDELQSDWIDEEHGDPTDGIEDSELAQCTENWKAAAADQQKKMWGIFHESGYFTSACRHGFVLWVADMIRSGELAKYPLAIVAKALGVLPPRWLMGYDIGCSFGGTILRSSLGPEFGKQKCRTCQWDQEKYQNLATMLHNNYVQALNILEDEAKALQADLVAKGITIEDLETYFVEESKHLKEIGKEAEGDLHAVAYTPADYEFLASAASYSRNLLDGRRAETKRRYLREQQDKTLFEVVQMETAMSISPRWELTDREYIETIEHSSGSTSYKMRTHISNALQCRSKAIQNAVKTYNSAAAAIGQPTLDWVKVTHYSFLDQFNILQDTRHSILDKKWADPVVRHLMKQHRQVARAKEEIQHCYKPPFLTKTRNFRKFWSI
ncbi:hypothetical protein EV359DRAFT_66742 [Lentinula novae-zelandiae]|nr:hypothetical protein EV359DRAFT_66742 [Lentinula novae-zelandiae]